MSPLSCLPAYFMFGKQELDSLACAQRIAKYATDKAVDANHKFLLVFLDQNLLHAVDQVQQHIRGIQQVGSHYSFWSEWLLYCGVVLCLRGQLNLHLCLHVQPGMTPCSQHDRYNCDPSNSASIYKTLLIAPYRNWLCHAAGFCSDPANHLCQHPTEEHGPIWQPFSHIPTTFTSSLLL